MTTGWHPDPYGLHEERYFADGKPTQYVRTAGVEQTERGFGAIANNEVTGASAKSGVPSTSGNSLPDRFERLAALHKDPSDAEFEEAKRDELAADHERGDKICRSDEAPHRLADLVRSASGTTAPLRPQGQPPVTSAPANWYPDPDVQGGRRYWDGTQWTNDRQGPLAEQPTKNQPDRRSEAQELDAWNAPNPSSPTEKTVTAEGATSAYPWSEPTTSSPTESPKWRRRLLIIASAMVIVALSTAFVTQTITANKLTSTKHHLERELADANQSLAAANGNLATANGNLATANSQLATARSDLADIQQRCANVSSDVDQYAAAVASTSLAVADPTVSPGPEFQTYLDTQNQALSQLRSDASSCVG